MTGGTLAGAGLGAYEDTNNEDSWDQNVGHILDTTVMGMEGNVTTQNGEKMFGNEWLNLSLYFLQYQFRTEKGGFLGISKVNKDEAPTNLLHIRRISGNNDKIGPKLLDNCFIIDETKKDESASFSEPVP